MAGAAGISHSTAKAWLSILESSYIVFLLQPYYENFKKRIIKSPKLYFYDTGLLCHLLGMKQGADMDENRLKGNIFENLIIAEYQKINYHNYLLRDYYFWRDSNQHEVDLLIKESEGFSIFEVKATQTIKSALFEQMNYFESIATATKVHKTLIYGGMDNQKRTHYDVLSWYNLNG